MDRLVVVVSCESTRMYSDLIVVGGGPAGSSLALFMAAHGWRVTQVDDARHSGFKPGEGLIPAAKRILKDLGVWEDFQQQGHLPSYGNDSLWGSSEVQSTDFIRSIDGHGWRLDRLAFDRLLREKGQASGVNYVDGFVELISPGENGWDLVLRDGQRLQCGWVADATGRSARIARQLGAKRVDHDQLVSFHLHFEASKAGDRYASSLIESTPEGWWYNALLPNGQRVVYFFSDAGLPVIKQAQSRDGFLDLLSKTEFVGQRLGEYGYVAGEQPQAADARSARLDQVSGDGWLAVGDAALSFDPLSSQGIMTALYAGLKAGQALVGEGKVEDLEMANGLAGYALAMEKVWEVYLANRTKFYRSEGRWVKEVFWERR